MSDRSDKAPQTPGGGHPPALASSADASGGRSPLRPSADVADTATDAAWIEWRARETAEARRLRALELAVELQGKQVVRGNDLLQVAERLLAWIENRPAPGQEP